MSIHFTIAAILKLKTFILVMPVLFCFPRVGAQEIFTAPPAKLLSTFKFEQLSGGIILLRGTLDEGTDSLNFILDTGSGGISLDSGTAANLGLKLTPTDRTIRGIAGIRKVDYAMYHSLHLPGITADSLDFHINDYELLTAVYGLRIDGIIGYSLIRRYIIYINYDLGTLSFYLPGSFRYARGGTLLRPAFNNLPIQKATLKDNVTVRQRFYFDTGGGLCLLLSQSFATDSTIFPKRKKMVPTVAEGLGGKKPMFITTLKEIRLGPYKFKKVPTYIFDDEYNVTSYPTLGGLLGADLLRRFNLTLNYPKAEIHLLPNSHFRDPFDYSYSGMEVYYEPVPNSSVGDVVVGEVLEHSPAEAAGLKVGDIIFSVDNIIGTSFQNVKSMLQNAGKRVKLIVMRDGHPVELKMKIGSID